MGVTSSLSNETKKFLPIKKYKKAKIGTQHHCVVKIEYKNLIIKNETIDKIDVYVSGKINDGRIFAINNKATILKKISVTVSSVESCVQIKVKIPNYHITAGRILNTGLISVERVLYEKKVKDMEFFVKFCGIDEIKKVHYSNDNIDAVLEITENQDFLKLYCRNLDSFLKNKENRKNYLPFYYKNETNSVGKVKVYLSAKSVREFYEFIREEVTNHFIYDNINDTIFSFWGGLNRKPIGDDSYVVIKMEYYDFYKKKNTLFTEKEFLIEK